MAELTPELETVRQDLNVAIQSAIDYGWNNSCSSSRMGYVGFVGRLQRELNELLLLTPEVDARLHRMIVHFSNLK